MEKDRLAAFSDGVIAIIITIMVLELRPPEEATFAALSALLPVFLSYVLSFIYVAIYWNNHHHMLAAVERVNGAVLWANMHLLFWLSIIPFATAWMGETHGESLPTAAYGFVLVMAAIAYFILQTALVRLHGKDSVFARAVRRDLKGTLYPAIYLAGIALAFWEARFAQCLYALVAIVWLVPDRRFERTFEAEKT
jgi:uncharacterized membrane protein